MTRSIEYTFNPLVENVTDKPNIIDKVARYIDKQAMLWKSNVRTFFILKMRSGQEVKASKTNKITDSICKLIFFYQVINKTSDETR